MLTPFESLSWMPKVAKISKSNPRNLAVGLVRRYPMLPGTNIVKRLLLVTGGSLFQFHQVHCIH